MSNARAWTVLGGLIALTLAGWGICTATGEGGIALDKLRRSSLKGLKGVHVAVDAEGLSNDDIKADVESWLERSNVPLLPAGSDGCGDLHVSISMSRRGNVCAVTITVSLLQQVQLVRDPSVTLPCATWLKSRTHAMDRRTVRKSVTPPLSMLVYDFAYAFLGENPA